MGITKEEIKTLRTGCFCDAQTLIEKEISALQYTRNLSQTPVNIPKEHIASLKEYFDEREIVILCTTAAQVNYWSRLNSGLGIAPACDIRKSGIT